MNSVRCPVCECILRQPVGPSLRSAPWGECACTDEGPCVAHQCDAEEMPERPSVEVLAQRARDEHAYRVQRYERMQERVAAYERLARERDAVTRWIEHARQRPHDSQAELVACLEDWMGEAACQAPPATT